MSETYTTDSAEALAEVLRAAGVEVGYVGGEEFRKHVAQALIASDWMKRHDAQVRAGVLRAAAEDVPLFEFMLVMDVASEVAPAQISAWLRDRAAALAEEGDRG